MSKAHICSVDGCSNEVKHPKSGLCGQCYDFLWYWKGRSPTARMKHVAKLDRWSSRAHDVLTPPQVTSITRARKRKAAAG